jgi:DNA repair protein RAD50
MCTLRYCRLHTALCRSLVLDQDEYRKIVAQTKTTEMAGADLDKYYHALDKYALGAFLELSLTVRALMKYHALKMEEINKLIKELWQQT